METSFTTTGPKTPANATQAARDIPLPQPSGPEFPYFSEKPIPIPPYDPRSIGRMTELLQEILDPAYILLFGSPADGTPHSDVIGYDLLIATHTPPAYDWLAARRYLKMKMPGIGHGAPYLNLYVYHAGYVVSQTSPFFWLARTEGILSYCSNRYKFRRPRKMFPFAQAACEARAYYATFAALGAEFLEQAGTALSENKIRQAAFFTAQAAVYFYRVLFRVYHGFEEDTHDLQIMHERTRTLSAELMLLFEPGNYDSVDTLSRLRQAYTKARYDPDFFISEDDMERHIHRIGRLRKLCGKLCSQRIAFSDGIDGQTVR